MLSINFEKFSGIYSSKIEPLLYDLEKERKKLRLYFCLNHIFIMLMFFLLFASMFFPIVAMTLWNNIYTNNVFFIGVPFFTAGFLLNFSFSLEEKIKKRFNQYKRKFKTKIHTKIFKLLDLDYKPSASPEFADYQNVVLKNIPTARLYSYIMKFEDGITGVFKDISFELCDATILKQHKIKSEVEKAQVPIFKGLMLAVKLNKSIRTETVIKSDNFKLFKIDKNVIKLEDTEFNKKFKVLADNEVEARYILTPSFMERLKNFHKSRKDKTIIFFDNSCSESKNMFILTNTGKDNFEIPFNKSILNEKYYYNLLKELVDMLEIAVALKLEQNIGL